MADKDLFGTPCHVKVHENSPGMCLFMTHFADSGENVHVAVGEGASSNFGWVITIVSPIGEHRFTGSGYSTKVDAICGLFDCLHCNGYERFAHGILADEWEDA